MLVRDTDLRAGGTAAEDESARVADALLEHHFLARDTRPADLDEPDLLALAPSLRALLFTDGTVTRALEAYFLRRVRLEVVDQHRGPAPAGTERHLGLDGGESCINRRVRMSLGDAPVPSVWAESQLIPERLPEAFLEVLRTAPEGIGASLQQLMLESARELLWAGIGAPPEWVTGAAVPETLVRLYRVTTHGEPALLISEAFAVERRAGVVQLADSATVPR